LADSNFVFNFGDFFVLLNLESDLEDLMKKKIRMEMVQLF